LDLRGGSDEHVEREADIAHQADSGRNAISRASVIEDDEQIDVRVGSGHAVGIGAKKDNAKGFDELYRLVNEGLD
jgi:hypothetical protein